MTSLRAAIALALLGLAAGVATAPAHGAPPAGARLYELVTETGMPHLEENLRYAVRTERVCLDAADLSTAFWMLREVSLQDCRLQKAQQDDDSAAYLLRCDGGRGTSGGARWQLEPQRLSGTLDVRLGGKNMTFYQRIQARPLGDCP
jgi:hypothetical protein